MDFAHIPQEEKKAKWFLLLEPLVKARKLRPLPEKSPLLAVLDKESGIKTWRDIKSSMETAFRHVISSERIFSRASQINTDTDPDGVIGDMFAELRTIPYLLYKGFTNIEYNRRDGLDFSCEFNGNHYEIEVAYVRGPTFKTQKQVFIDESTAAPIFQLEAKKLVNRLKSVCDEKEKQVLKYGRTYANTLVFVISDLDELYEPWLNHDEFRGNHPILGFVISRKIPTVVFSPGTVYEPPSTSLDGVFGKLKIFDWTVFSNQFSTDNASAAVNEADI